jgi:BNR/Asp-box repeat
MKLIRSLAVLFVGVITVTSNPMGSSLVSATSSSAVWEVGEPRFVRFAGVSVSKNGQTAFAVPDPAAPANPPAKGFRSSDGGATWVEMASMESRYWMSVDTSADGQVVFATGSVYVGGAFQSAVFKSVDSGDTWSTVIAFDSSSPSLMYGDVSVSEDGQKVVVGSNSGVMYSSNQGATWTSIWSGDARGVAISGDGSVIMVQEFYVGIHKSTDSGSSWTTVNSSSIGWSRIGLSTNGSSAIAISVRSGGQGGAFFTRDGGTTWTEPSFNTTFADSQYAIGAISPDGNTMIASSYYSQPYVSFDGGVTWSLPPQNILGLGQWTGFAVSNSSPTSAVAGASIIGITEANGVIRFGTHESEPTLPATGTHLVLWPAVLVLLLGVAITRTNRHSSLRAR